MVQKSPKKTKQTTGKKVAKGAGPVKSKARSKPKAKKETASAAKPSKKNHRQKNGTSRGRARPKKKPAASSAGRRGRKPKPAPVPPVPKAAEPSPTTRSFVGGGFACEMSDGKLHCDRCGMCIRGPGFGPDSEDAAQRFHADCFLQMHPEAKARAAGLIAHFSKLAPGEQSLMLEFLHVIHVTPERHRQLQACPTEDYEGQETLSEEALDGRIAGHKELVSLVAKDLASSQLTATLAHHGIQEIRAAVALAEEAQVEPDLPALVLAKQRLCSHDSLGSALRSRNIAELEASVKACLQCGLHPKTHKGLAAAQDVLVKHAQRQEALALLKAARRTRDPKKMAQAARQALASGVEDQRLILEVSTDAVAIQKSRKRSRMLEARWDLQQLSCLEPDVSSDDLREAMEVAKDAGVADDVLEAADNILTKKLLLEDIAVAMRSLDAGKVQTLCAMAEHAGLPSARLGF